MKECLLCTKRLADTPSWKSLLGLDQQTIICEDCSKKFQRAEIKEEDTSVLDKVTSLYTYNEAMRDYLHQFKFLQDIALSSVFANELRVHLPKDAVIVPIPMHREKRIVRTFAQVDELLNSAGVPFVHLLEKTGTEVMGEKTKAGRLTMKPLFKLIGPLAIEQKTVILVDDIYTTGTTLRHAATVLKEAGAERVEAVTLIRA
ncbi:ComF family protein [Sporosarcina siberiensis]|uniref:ComF family protein n=1 Tax=Sporosarcina siberiensis TaxID=1365606 RepID=A0ABW4SD58_9BACL